MKVEEGRDRLDRIPPTRETITAFNLAFETVFAKNAVDPGSETPVVCPITYKIGMFLGKKHGASKRGDLRKTIIIQEIDDDIVREREYLYFRGGSMRKYEFSYPVNDFDDEDFYIRKSKESTVFEEEGIKLCEDLGFTFVSEAELVKLVDLLRLAAF